MKEPQALSSEQQAPEEIVAEPFSPHLTWRPLWMILPLDLLDELDAEWTNSELRAFVRSRIAAGDPGPLFLDEGGATTPLWDLEIERANLLDLLRWRANLP